ncbi:unnamed protein product [Blepharisma stoltei]|uniref:Uncharacterized protein n=1 Tax=Blepharisma stoltei TaxID=1481888 RepID=A0AAU9IYD2_9CILI|nr:unnamed protein product [Blepharisma stoltei]
MSEKQWKSNRDANYVLTLILWLNKIKKIRKFCYTWFQDIFEKKDCNLFFIKFACNRVIWPYEIIDRISSWKWT